MSNLPTLTESAIRERATERSWARGRGYYEDGSVADLVWRAGELFAEVYGNSYESYQVHVKFSGDDIVHTDCSCPYDWGGDCKHIIAVLLTLMHGPGEIAERPAIDELIAHLNRDQLASLIGELAGRHPMLSEEIERIAPAAVGGDAGLTTGDAPLPALAPVDFGLLRRQIAADMRGSIEHGYDGWGGEAWYDSDLSSALTPALNRVRAFLDAGDARYALKVLTETTQAWDDGADGLHEYFREYFEESGADFTSELGGYWAEAILSADLSPDERQEWVETLEEMIDSIFAANGLVIALTAALEGWDDPTVVAAMKGTVAEQEPASDGEWEDEWEDWESRELTRIRLEILEKRGQYQEYLNLARVEGFSILYMQMLVKQGQSELAVEEAQKLVTTSTEAHALAKTLLDQGEVESAFALAQRGLSLKERRTFYSGSAKPTLTPWLRDEAHKHGRPELALSAGQMALAEETTLSNYRALQMVAGDQWAAMKAEALELVARAGEADGQVDIFLHEGMYDKAIAAVDQAKWFSNIDKVIEAVKVDYPDWAFQQCCKQAESIMDAGRAKDYDVAASWLRRGRDIMLAADKRAIWDSYLNRVMDIHHRKYKLMPMLRALQ